MDPRGAAGLPPVLWSDVAAADHRHASATSQLASTSDVVIGIGLPSRASGSLLSDQLQAPPRPVPTLAEPAAPEATSAVSEVTPGGGISAVALGSGAPTLPMPPPAAWQEHLPGPSGTPISDTAMAVLSDEAAAAGGIPTISTTPEVAAPAAAAVTAGHAKSGSVPAGVAPLALRTTGGRPSQHQRGAAVPEIETAAVAAGAPSPEQQQQQREAAGRGLSRQQGVTLQPLPAAAASAGLHQLAAFDPGTTRSRWRRGRGVLEDVLLEYRCVRCTRTVKYTVA